MMATDSDFLRGIAQSSALETEEAERLDRIADLLEGLVAVVVAVVTEHDEVPDLPQGVFTLYYSAPVEVTFDTRTGRVTDVAVDDVNAVFTGRVENEDGSAFDGDAQALADAADDTGYGWPEWEMGVA